MYNYHKTAHSHTARKKRPNEKGKKDCTKGKICGCNIFSHKPQIGMEITLLGNFAIKIISFSLLILNCIWHSQQNKRPRAVTPKKAIKSGAVKQEKPVHLCALDSYNTMITY